MTGILIFSLVLVLLTIGFRYIGSWYYDKVYGKKIIETEPEVFEQDFEELDNNYENDEVLVAVITAAAIETFKAPVTVTKIKSLSSKNESAWSLAGRQNVMGGHSININR